MIYLLPFYNIPILLSHIENFNNLSFGDYKFICNEKDSLIIRNHTNRFIVGDYDNKNWRPLAFLQKVRKGIDEVIFYQMGDLWWKEKVPILTPNKLSCYTDENYCWFIVRNSLVKNFQGKFGENGEIVNFYELIKTEKVNLGSYFWGKNCILFDQVASIVDDILVVNDVFSNWLDLEVICLWSEMGGKGLWGSDKVVDNELLLQFIYEQFFYEFKASDVPFKKCIDRKLIRAIWFTDKKFFFENVV